MASKPTYTSSNCPLSVAFISAATLEPEVLVSQAGRGGGSRHAAGAAVSPTSAKQGLFASAPPQVMDNSARRGGAFSHHDDGLVVAAAGTAEATEVHNPGGGSISGVAAASGGSPPWPPEAGRQTVLSRATTMGADWNIRTQEDPFQAAMGICMAPGRTKSKRRHNWARDLEVDLKVIRQVYRAGVLVVLLQRDEMARTGVPHLLEEAAKMGLETIHYPIRDKFVPTAGLADFQRLIVRIVAALRSGLRVVAHCNGGKGRSGLVLAATLLLLRFQRTAPKDQHRLVSACILTVQHLRSGTLRNPMQKVYLWRFHRQLASAGNSKLEAEILEAMEQRRHMQPQQHQQLLPTLAEVEEAPPTLPKFHSETPPRARH